MRYFALSALALAILGSTASASTYVLDFDADPNNAAEAASLDSSAAQVITSPRVFTDAGVTWSVTSSGGEGVALFDTTCSYGFGKNGCAGDADLEVFDQMNSAGVSGNVLIQQTDDNNNTVTPNDDRDTTFLTLELLTDISLEWTGASALDDGFYSFALGDSTSTNVLGTVDNGDGRDFDNTVGSIDFSSTGLLSQGDFITVFFATNPTSGAGASGAVDNFRFNIVAPVPVPASLPLLVGGFGLMAFMRRRRKAA